MKITDYLTPNLILLDLESTAKRDVLMELSEVAFNHGLVPDAAVLNQGLLEREGLISTGIGEGVAIPHTRIAGPKKIFVIIARSRKGVDFDSLDGEPVRLFVTIVGPENADKDQLKVLSRAARLLKQPEFRETIMNAETEEEVLAFIRREEVWV